MQKNSKNAIWALLALLVVQGLVLVQLCSKQFEGKNTSLIDFTVVIDAGHGGIDGGVVASDGTKESSLNLRYANTLGQILQESGFNVLYTRTSEGGLYGLPTKGFKMRDMRARKKIVEDSRPNLLISIHMNNFPDSTQHGPQVFFQSGSDVSFALATKLQAVLNSLAGTSRDVQGGDFYMCREVACPAVIVECGFFSNKQELASLLDEGYRQQLCSKIYAGIMLYLYSADSTVYPNS